jgi:hypothetical protein
VSKGTVRNPTAIALATTGNHSRKLKNPVAGVITQTENEIPDETAFGSSKTVTPI